MLTADSAGECRNGFQLDGTQQQNDSLVVEFLTHDPTVVLDVTDLTGNCHALVLVTATYIVMHTANQGVWYGILGFNVPLDTV